MDYTDNSIRRFWNALLPNLKKLIRKETDNCIRRIPAEVVGVEDDPKYATVRLCSSPSDSSQNMRLMNCTGKALKLGDAVWLEYMYSMDTAFIAIKNDGKPWGW